MQQQERALTRQGVPNLNGPQMDGRYNGRRISCTHHRDPSIATYSVRELRGVTRVTAHYCTNCGEERYVDGHE